MLVTNAINEMYKLVSGSIKLKKSFAWKDMNKPIVAKIITNNI
jgi:hypothetical protein